MQWHSGEAMSNQLKNATDLAVSRLRLAFSEELAGEGESEGEEDIVAESLEHVVCAFIEGRRAALAHRADARNEADAHNLMRAIALAGKFGARKED